jgi:catechol 2,3-dioxygenase-like lactoylglutathione lyase family enzyme
MSQLRTLLEDAFADRAPSSSIVKPYVLSHGTLESYSLKNSRRFYEDFLGMECVQHGPKSMAIRCGMKFHVICVEVGEKLQPVGYLNHWGVDVASRHAVDEAHAAAHAHKETYGIGRITETVEQHGVYSFYFEDLDHNWWEIQHYEAGFQHSDIFDFGDVFESSKPGTDRNVG